MYVLMLSVVFIVLVIISILISDNKQIDNKSRITNILQGSNILDIDISRSFCFNKYDSDSLGFYNLSVRKILNGYRGIIRASTWNSCCYQNAYSPFSYPYEIELDDLGNVTYLKRVPLNYDNITCCKSFFRGIHANGIEDPRLFFYQNEEWIVGNCLGSDIQYHPCINSTCIFKLSDPKNTFRILTPPIGVDILQRQKNWSPFEYRRRLYFEYSIEPHIILDIDLETGIASEIYHTGSSNSSIMDETSLRGGTPPILIDGKYYLSVGHIRSGESSDYYHFFYLFEPEPPFK